MAPQKNIPFRKWVPSWLRAVVGFSILLPIMLINGAYTGSSVDISSALSVLSEDINMGYYAASAGMAVGYPLIPKIRPIVTTKTVLLCDFILQVILSFICANTGNIYIIIGISFIIGFLKAFALLEMIIILKPIFSKKDVRSEFYAYFYPIVFGIGQISMILTAELAYNYQWQYMYYLVIILLLIAIILVMTCFRYGRRPIKIPFKDIDGASVLLVSTILLCTIYACTYGKIRDWFAAPDIAVCSIIIPLGLFFFIRRQLLSSTPYVNLAVIKHGKSIIGYFFMAVVMFFSSSSSLVSSYTTSVLKLDSIHTNGLNLVMIPGFILGAIICFWWFRMQIWRFRVLIFWGMACFVGYFGILYFGITPDGSYEFLFLPTFLRGMGMIILFIAFGVYVVEDIDPKLMISNAFFLVSIRSLISPVIGASIFTNLIYRLQQRNIMILGESINLQNNISASQYQDALSSGLRQGLSTEDAHQYAVTTLSSILNIQALLLSIKMILGIMLIIAIVIMVVARFTPFHKTLKVKTVKSGEDMA